MFRVQHSRGTHTWYKTAMAERLNGFMADRAEQLVRENFTGVRAEWWWERRLDGGIEICQELAPKEMARRISSSTGRDTQEVEALIEDELGLEDAEPVTLTFEIPGETAASEAARMLAERSSSPEGLAANLYRRIEEAARRG